jgi:N-acetylglucosamine kinase-like BadF-type ATPase
MQAYDGRGQKTRLTKLVLDHYGLQNPQELISMIYSAESQRFTIAGLSPLVEQAADFDDSVATAILDEAAHELTRTIAAIASKLGSSSVPLVITGGTILHGKNLWKVFHRACEMQGLTFSAIRRIEEPAQGALQCARLLLA